MEKRREIPASAATKNLAPKADIDRVIALLDTLGIDNEKGFVETLKRSRATYFRLKRYDATVAIVREVEEALVREAHRLAMPVAPTRTEQDELIEAWRELGETLLLADPSRFTTLMDGLRDMVEAAQLQQRAIHKIFRATPDASRK